VDPRPRPAALPDQRRYRGGSPQTVEQARQFYEGLATGLIAFAEAHFELERAVGEGKAKTPRRAHLEILARDGDPASIAELYHGPKLPKGAAHVWGYWIALCETRTSSGFGPNPITRHDVHAWEADEGHALEPWERRSIFRLDAIYRRTLIPEESDT
jgi:hypothetical protein